MKTIIRNFLSVLRRFKMATVLNIAGLTVAFAAFMIILMQVRHEYNYDRFHPKAKNIFRLDQTIEGVMGMVQARPFFEEFLTSSPHIEAGGFTFALTASISFYVDDEFKTAFRESVSLVDPGFVKVFDFPILQGDPDCLDNPKQVLITESLAKRLFGNEDPVGKVLKTDEYIWMSGESSFTIGAVYKDFPGNTQLVNGIFIPIAKDQDKDNYYSRNYICYIRLDNPASAKLVEDNFNSYYEFNKQTFGISSETENLQARLYPLVDIYYNNPDVGEIVIRTGSRETAIILICIALFVIIIAAINFTNFSTSLAPMRIKSINTQKVLGSSDGLLKIALLSEAILVSLVSCLLALGLVFTLQKLAVFSFIEAEIKLADNIGVVLFTLLLSLLVGLIAGLYPARYMTSFPPALVLKGNFGLSPKGRQLRTGLMGFQFVVSIVLIIVTLFVYLQRDYIKHYTVGFDKDQVAVVQVAENIYESNREVYINKLKAYPGIEDVAFSTEQVGGKDVYSMNFFKYLDEEIFFFQLFVSPNFFSVMGIDVVEGRAPYEKEEGTKYIFSKSVMHKHNLPMGWHSIHSEEAREEVIGFAEDVSLTSLRKSDYNVAYIVNQNTYTPFSYIRLKAGTDYRGAVEHIRSTIGEITPLYPVEVNFYDELFNQLYKKEENLNKMISLFSLLAIIISVVGVFGLVVFETQYRKKEIGIRKVMGAEVRDILIMFNKTYFNIVVVCFIIGAPIAWYSAARWLENFADKTPMYAWVYMLAFVIVAFIVMATVTLQNWQAATDNPVDSIKTE